MNSFSYILFYFSVNYFTLQLAEEKAKNAERDADLPVVAGGSLGTFKNGLQSLPLRVSYK